jgi:hypothetical protein
MALDTIVNKSLEMSNYAEKPLSEPYSSFCISPTVAGNVRTPNKTAPLMKS